MTFIWVIMVTLACWTGILCVRSGRKGGMRERRGEHCESVKERRSDEEHEEEKKDLQGENE